jgi:hypothetical protein
MIELPLLPSTELVKGNICSHLAVSYYLLIVIIFLFHMQ